MPPLTKTELDQLWARNAQVPGAISTSVQELIAQRAGTQSDQPAITAWDGDCNYGHLMHLASSLADYLARNVPHRGGVLPIVMKKSKWVPVAMLGALIGGWGIAPLDVNTPAARLAKILDMLDPPCILTTSEVRIEVNTAVPALPVDGLSLKGQSPSYTEQPAQSTSMSAKVAAVVFTSGSTGSPKGVMLGPECISTAAVCGSQILRLGQGSRLFQFSSLSFDISLHEIFMTLVAGGCLCIPSETERIDSPVEAIKRMQANCICTTPSVIMSVFAEAVASTPIKTIVLTGEALTSRIRPLFYKGLCIFSWYGASECPIVALAPLDEEHWMPCQISSRYPGNCWVVRSQDSGVLCDFGEVGELLVESPMLALGYLNAPQQTEAAFVVDPAWLNRGHGRVPGRRGRLYRTGDVVRNNQDWTFNYIGRKDAIVKIRGQRVDLSEVEFFIWEYLRSGHLESPVRVMDVVVEPINSNKGSDSLSVSCFLYVDRRLSLCPRLPRKCMVKSTSLPCVDIYAPDATLQHLQSGIDGALRFSLPPYMVPSLYFELSRVPLTPSGKVDRRLLRSLASHISSHDLLECRPCSRQDDILPPNDTESALQRLWGEVLGVEATAIRTSRSFLECGGDSLSAILLSKALTREFGLRTKVPQLLRREATIQYLARLLGQSKDDQTDDEPRMDIATVLRAWVARLAMVSSSLPSAPGLGRRDSQVLLTGATGYLGTHILGELLSGHWASKVIVLVRAADLSLAEERVREVAITAGWWQQSAVCHIEVWIGNLAEPRLGLQQDKWAEILNMDIIIHNGAVVNYSAGYDVLERANVLSTFHLLEAALQSQHLCAFIYISGGIKQGQGQSDAEYLRTLNASEGYSQTKYVSEQLTLAAGRLYHENAQSYSRHGDEFNPANGTRTFTVIKPGYIVGDQATGLSNTDDFIWKLVAGAIHMGSFPSDPPGYWLDIAEMTYVARHIAHRAQLGATNASPCPQLMTPPSSSHSDCSSSTTDYSRGNGTTSPTVIFDEVNRGLPVDMFWHAIQSQAQLSLQQMDWASWIGQAHIELEGDNEAHPLWGIQLLLGPSLGAPSAIVTEGSRARPIGASGALEEVEAAVRRCVQYLCKIQFIVLPPKGEACLDSSDAHGKHLTNDIDDGLAGDQEHLAKRRAMGSIPEGRHHPIISRSKLTCWN